jgi:hypothetical protein
VCCARTSSRSASGWPGVSSRDAVRPVAALVVVPSFGRASGDDAQPDGYEAEGSEAKGGEDAMTLEQVKLTRDGLTPDERTARDTTCEQGGHVWRASETNVPQQYCGRCFRLKAEIQS